MSVMASQITSFTMVHSTVYSGADQRKHQSSASLVFWGNSPVTGQFPAQRASNAENVSIWWRHHEPWKCRQITYDTYVEHIELCLLGAKGFKAIYDSIVFNFVVTNIPVNDQASLHNMLLKRRWQIWISQIYRAGLWKDLYSLVNFTTTAFTLDLFKAETLPHSTMIYQRPL